MPVKNRIDGLKSIRFFCFLIIFLSHSFDFDTLHILSYLSVTTFIILSAFILSYRYDQEELEPSLINNLKFVFERIKKSYPLYLITLILFIILSVNDAINNLCDIELANKFPKIIFYNSLLLQSWFLDRDILLYGNSVSWFLSALVFYYFLFPYFRKYLKDLSYKKSLLTIVICIIVQIVVYLTLIIIFGFNILDTIVFFPLLKFPQFVAGICLYNIWKDKKESILNNKIDLLEILLILCTIAFFIKWTNDSGIRILITRIYSFIASLILIYLFALKKGIITRSLTNKITIYLGEIASYAWLIHGYIIQLLMVKPFFLNHNIYLNSLIYLIISLLFGLIYFKIININKIRRLFNHKDISVINLGLLIITIAITFNYTDRCCSWYKSCIVYDSRNNIMDKVKDFNKYEIVYDKLAVIIDENREVDNKYFISGWAFPSAINGNKYAVALVMNNKIYYCNRNERKDVQKALNVANSILGFNVLIDENMNFEIWVIDSDNKVIYK